MSSEDQTRLAVLIDADNTSPKMTREMFEELAGYGTLTVKRAYGDWTSQQLNGWKGELHKHAISPMQQFANTSGKNSTDSALIIDAMDLLYAGNLDGFVIVSSDADFTRLATRLRESGMTVYGVGQRKTPRPFQDACDKFTFLEVLREPDSGSDAGPDGGNDGRGEAGRAPSRGATPEAAVAEESGAVSSVTTEDTAPMTKGQLQSMLTKALHKTASDDDDWSALGALGSLLNRTDPSFDPRTYGFAKLSDLVKAQPFLETRTVTASSGQGQLWTRVKGGRTPARTETGEGRNGAKTAPRSAAKTTARKTSRKAAAAAPETADRPGGEADPVVDAVDAADTSLPADPSTSATAEPSVSSADPRDDAGPDAAPRKRTAARKATRKPGTTKAATRQASAAD